MPIQLVHQSTWTNAFYLPDIYVSILKVQNAHLPTPSLLSEKNFHFADDNSFLEARLGRCVIGTYVWVNIKHHEVPRQLDLKNKMFCFLLTAVYVGGQEGMVAMLFSTRASDFNTLPMILWNICDIPKLHSGNRERITFANSARSMLSII